MEPVAYGLKFAGALSGGSFLKGDFSSQLKSTGVDATAYAVRMSNGHASVVILNKDAEKDLDVTLEFGAGVSGRVVTETLHAPALDSREARITGIAAPDHLRDGKCSITVPHATGLRLTLH